jgi:predicted nucleic acid-binding protein
VPRDTLLRAAELDLFRPCWSNHILAEVERNLFRLLVKRGRADAEARVRHLLATLRAQFPEAIVADYEALIPTMTNSPNDRHVLAAAVASEAATIVTDNVCDFPPASTKPYGIAIMTPDDFLLALFEREPEQLLAVLARQAAEMRQPKSLADLLRTLQLSTPRFVDTIRRYSVEEPKRR